MRELIVASKNEKKLRELERYLKGVKARIVSLKGLSGSPRIIEDRKTFQGNAMKKALTVSRWRGALALADDSGLVVRVGREAGRQVIEIRGP